MNNTDQLLCSIEHDNVIIGLRDDHIIHVYFKSNCEINSEAEELIFEASTKLLGQGQVAPFIFEAGEFISVNLDAEEVLSTTRRAQPATCYAMYVQNAAQRLIVNYYMKWSQPTPPYHSFRSFDDAVKWCKTKMQHEENNPPVL